MHAQRRSAPVAPSLVVRVGQRAVTASDGFRAIPSRPAFSSFTSFSPGNAACLAYPEDGHVWCDLIRRLPHWEKNSMKSVGEQIRRHILQTERQGRNVIEWRERIKGTFRLTLPPDADRRRPEREMNERPLTRCGLTAKSAIRSFD